MTPEEAKRIVDLVDMGLNRDGWGNRNPDKAYDRLEEIGEFALACAANSEGKEKAIVSMMLDLWRQETTHIASPTQCLMNRWARALKSICLPSVAILIEELDRNPDKIPDLLREITGESPTKMSSRGRWDRQAKDWKKWWKKRGNQ